MLNNTVRATVSPKVSPDFVTCSITFTAGVLEGITINTEIHRNNAKAGKVVKECVGSGKYRVNSVIG